MVYSFSDAYVPIFAGVNDTPVVPEVNKMGNGSDIIARHNELITQVSSYFEEVSGRIGNLESAPPPTSSGTATAVKWRLAFVENNTVTVANGDKLFLFGAQSPVRDIRYSAPAVYPPQNLFEFTILNRSNCNLVCNLTKYENQNVSDVFVDAGTNKPVTFIYLNSTIGWISTDPSLVRIKVSTGF